MSIFSRFEVPQPRSLTDDVYDVLRRVIYSSVLSPGSWLREEALASELDVSRITIRTALNHLVAEGLATRTPNKGVRVAMLSLEELNDLYEMRSQLEKMAFESATDHITDAELDAMESLLAPFDGILTREAVCELIANCYEFHWIPIKASHRSQLSRVLASLLAITMSHGMIMMAYRKGYSADEAIALASGESPFREDELQGFYRDYVNVLMRGNLDHEVILAALRKRDKAEVGRLIAEHLHLRDDYPAPASRHLELSEGAA